MTLQEFIAEKKLLVFEDLASGRVPSAGRHDKAHLESLSNKGEPQMGTTRFEPNLVTMEFIFMSEGVSVGVLQVRLDPPERIVFMPVPKWVVETVWQGDVDGSYHFESDAERLMKAYTELLKPLTNIDQFKKRKIVGRS